MHVFFFFHPFNRKGSHASHARTHPCVYASPLQATALHRCWHRHPWRSSDSARLLNPTREVFKISRVRTLQVIGLFLFYSQHREGHGRVLDRRRPLPTHALAHQIAVHAWPPPCARRFDSMRCMHALQPRAPSTPVSPTRGTQQLLASLPSIQWCFVCAFPSASRNITPSSLSNSEPHAGSGRSHLNIP